MAVLWQKCVGGTQYEVRTAGHSRRLYTDGVFHSQYNPKRPLTHGVWDLLMLPALFYPAGEIKRVLVLGVGGGAVIKLLQHFVSPNDIVGIELNPVHLNIAQRFFGVDAEVATLYEADAIEWLKAYNGPAFDLIIDDLFGEVDGEPQRVVELDLEWCSALHRHTSRHGVVVVNSMSPYELRQSAFMKNARLAKQYASRIQLSLPVYENAVGAFFKPQVTSQQLQQRLSCLKEYNSFKELGFHQQKIRGGKNS